MFNKYVIVFILSLSLANMVYAGDQYGSNPFTFPVIGTMHRFGDRFFVVDLNGDGEFDFTYRTETAMYAYDHDGSFMWQKDINVPSGILNGNSHGAADINGDGNVEIVALNNTNQIVVYNGFNGSVLDTVDVSVGSTQKAAYISVVNLRGMGDRDVIVQTIAKDYTVEGNWRYYVNRALIALNMESDPVSVIWQVAQDYTVPPIGYWGLAHGGPMCADVDGDGRDEVIGGNMIDHEGTVTGLNYPTGWIETGGGFMDHLDALAVGDFLPGTAGLEWIVTEEDHNGKTDWNATMLNHEDVQWRKETTLFPASEGSGNDREPQNVAAGNFDLTKSDSEVMLRSRFEGYDTHDEGWGQHPWVFDVSGTQFSHYSTVDSLPAGFNTSADTNASGIECIWTVDWDGGEREYIAAIARKVDGNMGVFNPITGKALWTTKDVSPQIQAQFVYVADVSGDSREEVIIYDAADGKIKILWNEDSNPNSKPDKWDDPLYRRLKQNWNYYSPGSYTHRDPVLLQVKVDLQGPYSLSANEMSTDLNYGNPNNIPTTSPYVEDPRVAPSIPSNITDWVLVQLRSHADSSAVISRSVFLRNDGQVVNEAGESVIELFVEDGEYYVVIRHRNHLAVMSRLTVSLSTGSANSHDFTTGTGQYYGEDAKLLDSDPTTVYGMYAGDANNNSYINAADYLNVKGMAMTTGYRSGDCNMNAYVNATDYLVIKPNIFRFSQVPD